MSEHLSKRAQLLGEILRYINDGNYEKAGDAWSFGVGQGASRDQANKDMAVFRKMRHLVYDHVARTVAIQRTSLSSPPSVDSLAGEFKKLMDELTPETREALGQAFGPIVAGEDSLGVRLFPSAQANWTRLIATTQTRFSKSWMELFPGRRRWTAWVWKLYPTEESSFCLKRRIAVISMAFT